MKVTIDIDENLDEECVVIKCRELSHEVIALQKSLMEQAKQDVTMLLFKDGKEYYIPLDKILFFETENKDVMVHTREEIYQTGYKLYELEELLPRYFMRISKSGIVNINHIFSITKNIASASVVEFENSHKCIYVSRNYYKALVDRLNERRRKL